MNRQLFRTARKIMNLRQGRTDWYSIKALAGQPAQVMIYDEIGFLAVTAQDFINDLKDITGPIELHLNSPGGEVFDGMAIYNYLRNRGDVTVHVDSLAASIVSVIAMAGDPVIMAKTARMMIHDGFGMAIGDAADMRKMADLLDETSDLIASVYADRTGKPVPAIRDMMRAETWFSAQQAVDEGFADQVQGAAPAAARGSWDLSVFRNAGGHDATDHPGRECWDGDGDCDLTAAGDTDHDYWAADGTQLKPVPGSPMDASRHHLLNAGADESAWDGGRAWANGSASDDPESFFRGICAGEKTVGNPDTQAHWALPHHYHPGDAPNRHGVSQALGRLDSTQDLKSASAARSHLEAHQSAMGGGTSDAFDDDFSWHIDPVLIRNALKGGKE